MAEERSGGQHAITHSRVYDHTAHHQRTNASDWHEEMQAAMPGCPQCGGPSTMLGQLGRTSHYRCRNCGATHSSGGTVADQSTDVVSDQT